MAIYTPSTSHIPPAPPSPQYSPRRTRVASCDPGAARCCRPRPENPAVPSRGPTREFPKGPKKSGSENGDFTGKNGGFLHGFNQTWGFMIAKLVSKQVNGWIYGRYIIYQTGSWGL